MSIPPLPCYELIFNASPIGATLLAPTPEATILAANDAFLRTANRRREEIVGLGLFDAFPGNPEDADDTGENALRASLAHALATRRPDTMPAQRYPIQTKMPDGELRYEERFWNAVNTPVVDAEGNVCCLLHTSIDITRQVQAEAALRKSEQEAKQAAQLAEAQRQRLHAVLQAVPVGIVMSDAEGSIVLSNAAHRKLWGKHPVPTRIDEFDVWKGWWSDGSERQGRRLTADEWTTARVLRGQEALHDLIEIEPFDADSERRICLNSGAPIRDEHSAIIGAVVAQLDLTDQVKAEQALKQADRRKDEFLAMLAHELRNPLAPIGAAADLLGLGVMDEARVRQTSAVIARQVRHMTGLVDDLLDVSRVTRGLVKLEKKKLDAKRIVADAVEQVRPLIEARGHRLAVHTPPEQAIVTGDQKRLVQVMTNLLTNAAKYTPEGGTLAVDMEFDGGHLKINVIDNGIGMAPDLVERAFELFAQAERTSDRSQGGLGIGLALVKSLMKLHGGSVKAHSDGVGKGSCFTVCLPYLQEQAVDAGAEQDAIGCPAATDALKVMVVDDNVDAARMLAMLVEAMGHQVIVEHNSRKAVEKARVERPQVCLLDIGLPDMDGNELARRLRGQPETAGAMLVAVTGYGQEQDRANAYRAGFAHHFVKPVDSAKLADLLRDYRRR